MTVRNFWFEAEIDSQLGESGGPRDEEGSMRIVLYRHGEGEAVKIGTVVCSAEGIDLVTRILFGGVKIFKTERD